ncbi:MAG: hypothetical protein AB1490_11960 [Pseudomonadota bacterium]
MLTKRLLTISLLMPLMAISSMANAGSRITDKNFWPNEVRQQTVEGRTVGAQSERRAAFAYQKPATRLQPAASDGRATWRYHGGPKFPQ